MKSLISIVCALLLLGCSNESPKSETPQAEPTPVTVETNVTDATVEPSETPATSTQPTSTQPTAAAAEPAAAPVASVDGSALYAQKCASCHGAKAEKAALGKSQVIAGWNEAQIKEALKGYQIGTYGKEMKGLMQGQAKALSDEQIDALAKHISTL